MRTFFHSRLCAAMMLLLLASGLRGFAAPPVVIVTNSPSIAIQSHIVQPVKPKKRYIVTLKDEVNPERFSDERIKLHIQEGRPGTPLKPFLTYHYALNGFANELDEDEVAALKNDKRVLFVEEDGPVTVEGNPRVI